MNVAEVRKRVKHALADAKRRTAAERAAREVVAGEFDQFLDAVAIPVFRMANAALKAEGHRFELVTPPGVVRLVPAGSSESFIELVLDETGDGPVVMMRSSVRRGRATAGSERPLRPGTLVPALTREDVLEGLLAGIGPFVT